ncbi:hypothetical protein [Phenylobacterium ferrooxidans]|uniref:DUF4019 domain-containing protein n=1 Tax=Phenylobacterium ferrooxidans TaxID=2982689 RepID=A0ABW6CRG4_9CAUL
MTARYPTRRGFVLAGVLALAACDSLKIDAKAEAVAKAAYVSLVQEDDAALIGMFEPAQRNPRAGAILPQMRALVPPRAAGAPLVPVPVLTNWKTFVGTGGTTLTLQHTYDYGDADIVVTSVLVPAQPKGDWWLRSFNINLTQSPPDTVAPQADNPKTPA